MKTLSATFFTVLILAFTVAPARASAESYKCTSVDQDVEIDVTALQTMDVLNPTQQAARQHLIGFSVSAGNLIFADTTVTAKVVTTPDNANKRLAGSTLSQFDTIAVTFDTHYRQATSDGKSIIAASAVYTRRNQQRLSQDFSCEVAN